MADNKPGTEQDQKPQNQADESHGSVRKAQTTDTAGQGKDLPRGAEGETRRASHGAR